MDSRNEWICCLSIIRRMVMRWSENKNDISSQCEHLEIIRHSVQGSRSCCESLSVKYQRNYMLRISFINRNPQKSKVSSLNMVEHPTSHLPRHSPSQFWGWEQMCGPTLADTGYGGKESMTHIMLLCALGKFECQNECILSPRERNPKLPEAQIDL